MLGLVHLEIDVGLEAADGAGEVLVGAGGLGAGARDDERRSCLVDQDGVDLVDDTVSKLSLYELLFVDHHVVTQVALVRAGDHIVAQVVKAELGVRAVGDVRLVGGLL